MKKLHTLFIYSIFALSSLVANAQIEIIGNENYGQLFDVQYAPTDENVLIARTVGNHIVQSIDNGASWDIVYSDEVGFVKLFHLRFLEDGNHISFIVSIEGSSYSAVNIYNLNTQEVVKQFSVPNPEEGNVIIESYALAENDWDTMVLHTHYDQLTYSHVHEVFYTSNGGTNWESVYYEPDYNEIAINNVALAPNNSEKIYLMRGGSPTSDIGGLFISEDAGASWREELEGVTFSALAFNPDNANDLILGTYYESPEQNIYRSTDGGTSWTSLETTWTDMSQNNINAISFNPQNTDEIIILEENEIVVSLDNGASWTHQVFEEIDSESYYYGLNASFRPNHPGQLVFATNFYSFTTDDYAASIEKLQNPFINSTGKIASFQSENENHLYYGLRGGFIHKNLQTGEETAHALMPLNQMFSAGYKVKSDPLVAGRVFTESRFGWDSFISVSTNHGENQEVAVSSFSFLILEDVEPAPSNTDIVWITAGPNIYKLDLSDFDNITSEEFFPGNIDEQIYALLVDDTDPNTVYAAQWHQLYKTTNGGADWEPITNGLETLNQGNDVILTLEYNPLNTNQYAMSTTQGIFLSNDKGASWELVLEGLYHNIAFSKHNEGAIVATTHFSDGYNIPIPAANANIVFSTDAGETWETVGSETLEYINTNSSTFQFEEDTAVVYFGVFDTGVVSYTIDLSTLEIQESLFQDKQIALFPNPTISLLTVASPLTVAALNVFNLQGQKVLTSGGFSNKTTIDLGALKTGVYIVEIIDVNGNKHAAKAMVK